MASLALIGDGLVVAAALIVLVRTGTMVALALAEALARRRRPRPACPRGLATSWPRVSVVIPAFNEERVLEKAIRGVAASDYPDLEILVVDDGSSDGTRSVAEALSSELPQIRVLSHPHNRGKAAALNSGFAAAKSELVVTIDADTVPAADAIRRLVAVLATEEVAAVASNVKVGNRQRWLARWQSIEYVTTLNLDRRAQARVGAVTTAPGAMSAWRREVVLDAGGFSGDTLTEDTDLTLALAGAGHRIAYADHAIARTEAPETLRALFRQRRRWLFGNLQCLWKHRVPAATAPRAFRWFGLPNFWFAQAFVYCLFPLSLVYLPRALAWLTPAQLLLTFAGLLLLDLSLALLAFLLDRESKSALFAAPWQRLLFPFFLWSVFAVVVTRVARGRPLRWRGMERTGTVSG